MFQRARSNFRTFITFGGQNWQAQLLHPSSHSLFQLERGRHHLRAHRVSVRTIGLCSRKKPYCQCHSRVCQLGHLSGTNEPNFKLSCLHSRPKYSIVATVSCCYHQSARPLFWNLARCLWILCVYRAKKSCPWRRESSSSCQYYCFPSR